MAAFSVSPSVDEVIASLEGVHAPASASSILVPIVSEQIADLETPVSAFLKLRSFPSRRSLPSVPLANVSSGGATPSPADSDGGSNYAFLLESVEGGERLARYSIVGFAPHGILAVGASEAAVSAARSRGAADTVALSGDPLAHVEAWLSKQHLVTPPALRGLPSTAFCGGAVGYVAYDAVRHFEPRTAPALATQADALGVPEAVFLQCDDLLLFDHVRHTIRVVVHIRLEAPADAAAGSAAAAAEGATRTVNFDRATVAAAYAGAVERIAAISAALAGPLPASFASGPRHSPSAPLSPASSASGSAAASAGARDLEAGSNMGRAVYEDAVRTLKGHIVEGDIIQAVPSHRIMHQLPSGVAAFDVYRHLRVVNPSPYMFYLDLGPGFQIVGASPEMLVKVGADGRVQTHPIAGTRRRGATPEEDEALAAELLGDEKERAEHVMLVDLGRNDIGRVAAPGTVKVDSLMHIEKYSHVQHIVSNVSGTLAPGKTAFDAFRAVFPAGTVSGAPKVRGVELVAGLERERRGVYAGAVGCISYSGVMDTAIAIRTLVIREGNKAFLQAGAGIVHDSVPSAEYDETIAKMRGVDRAIQSAIAAAEHSRGATGAGAAHAAGAAASGGAGGSTAP